MFLRHRRVGLRQPCRVLTADAAVIQALSRLSYTPYAEPELHGPGNPGEERNEARRRAKRRQASNCPSWARTRTLLIPCHFGFRRRSQLERSWSGLCLHLRRYAVRWLPPSLYTFPFQGLARRCRLRVRRLREHSRASFPAWCPASAPSGAARVRRVASYTKGQRYFSLPASA